MMDLEFKTQKYYVTALQRNRRPHSNFNWKVKIDNLLSTKPSSTNLPCNLLKYQSIFNENLYWFKIKHTPSVDNVAFGATNVHIEY